MVDSALLVEALAWWGGGLAAIFLCFEVAARAGSRIPLLSRDNFIAAAWGDGALVRDPLIGWRLRDHYRSVDGTFTAGRHGVRLTGGSPTFSEGGVLVVGDSFTVGPGLADRETWPAHLERLLDRPVINGSCGGYGVDQIVLRAEQLAQTHQPAAIVLALLDHDILRNGFARFGGEKPWFALQGDGDLTLEGVPDPGCGPTGRQLDPVRRIAGHSYLLQTLFSVSGARDWWLGTGRFARVHGVPAAVEVGCRLMRRVAGLRDQFGVPVVVTMLYNAATLGEDAPEWFAGPVLDAARAQGLVTVDTFPGLHGLCRDDPARFASLWLPTPWPTLSASPLARLGYLSDAGSATIAGMVADALRGEGGLQGEPGPPLTKARASTVTR